MRKALYILGQLSDTDVEWLLRVGHRRQLDTGTVLITQGCHTDALSIVLGGELSVRLGSADGPEIARLASGEIVGEMSFVDAAPPSATVVAVDDATVFSIPTKPLRDHLRTDATFAARFYRAVAVFLSQRLRQATGRLGYGGPEDLDDEALAPDELDDEVLDNVHLAGARFTYILQRLAGQ